MEDLTVRREYVVVRAVMKSGGSHCLEGVCGSWSSYEEWRISLFGGGMW